MMDFNSTLFYKAKFLVQADDETEDLLWNLVLKIREWMSIKWKKKGIAIAQDNAVWTKWKFGGTIESEKKIVYFKSEYHRRSDGLECWASRITESWPSAAGFAPRDWITEIGFQEESRNCAEISIVIHYNDRPGFIGPCQDVPDATTPGLIRKIITDRRLRCTVNGQAITLKPKKLQPGDFPEFWKKVCDSNRDVHIVYISPRRKYEESDETDLLVNPDKLATILGTNAWVYYSQDVDFSREMTQMCSPSELGCYRGAVRVYAPHMNWKNSQEKYRHRLICARQLDDGEYDIYDILRRALAQDVHFYEKMFRIEDCRKLNDRAKAEKSKQEYKDHLETEFLEDAIKQENNLKEDRLNWELEQELLKDKIDELQRELYASKAREDNFRDEALVSGERKTALDKVRTITKYPDSPRAVAEYFVVHFRDRIDFTERGWSSLDECKTSLEVLWDALYQMATTLYDLFEDDNISAVDKEFNQRSKLIMARGEGSMTRKDAGLLRQYMDTYCGKNINIQAHIKTTESKESSPKFLRIYFYYDSQSRKIIIGSCGKHFENYTTQKIK